MRKILSTAFGLFLAVSAAGAFAPAAHASLQCKGPNDTEAVTCSGTDVCDTSSGYGVCMPAASGSGSSAAPSGTTDPSAQKTTQPAQQSTSSLDFTGRMMTEIMSLFAWLLGVAAITLDNAAFYTVAHMGTFINGLSAVGTVWRILRDLGNIVLIFGFIAIGVSIILDQKWYGGGTKMLPTLLVAAVFLNFSLFISEAVIDLGNYFATEFYTQVNGGSLPTVNQLNVTSSTNIHNEGISNAIMSQLGLAAIYGDALNPQSTILTNTNEWIIGFMGIILFMVAAFVMFTLAFVLIARFIILLFLIIVAPIGFAGLAVPQLKGTADNWWSTLFEQTVTAPILMLMLYVALAVITDAKFLTGFGVSGSNSAASNGAASAWTAWVSNPQSIGGLASVILSFLVAMGLLLMVTMLTKRMSAFGADWAKRSAGAIVGGFAGYGVLGGMSLGMRGTVGLAARAANSKRVQAAAAGTGAKAWGARALAFTGRNLEGRTFDYRNSRLAQAAGGAVRGTLSNFGMGSTGFEQIRLGKGATVSAKQAVEKAQEFGKVSGLTEVLTGGSLFDGTWWRDQQKKYEEAKKDLERKEKLEPTSTDFVKTIQKSSAEQLAEMRGIRKGLDAFVQAIKPSQYSALQKSKDLLEPEKKNLRDKWELQFDSVPKAQATLARFNREEIASLDSDMLIGNTKIGNNIVDNLTERDFEAIRQKQGSNLDLDKRRAIYARMTAPGSPLAAVAASYFNRRNDKNGSRMNYWNV